MTRLKEIARFSALCSSHLYIIKFCLLQIPFILPYAIPISALIASILLFSHKQEILTLRSSGLSLKEILTPILAIGFALFIVNFLLISEITPLCREEIKYLTHSKASINPLLLLKRKNLSRLKTSFIDLKEESQDHLKQVICFVPSFSQGRFIFLSIDDLTLDQDTLKATNSSLITYHKSKNSNNSDTLFIENDQTTTIPASIVANALKTKHWSLNFAYMPLAKLFSHYFSPDPSLDLKELITYILRRFSIGFSAFSFTLLGSSLGIHIGRRISIKKIALASIIALSILATFILGKAFCHAFYLSCAFYLFPQAFLILFCRIYLKRINRGIE